MTKQQPTFLSVAEVAEALHLSVRAIHHRIAKGDIVATKIGTGRTNAYVIERDEFDRIKRHEEAEHLRALERIKRNRSGAAS